MTDKKTLPDFSEIAKDIRYLEAESFWIAYYQPLGISVIGKTKEDSTNGLEKAYNSHK
jgi:hypothetical protein